jgi:hypothetical protein
MRAALQVEKYKNRLCRRVSPAKFSEAARNFTRANRRLILTSGSCRDHDATVFGTIHQRRWQLLIEPVVPGIGRLLASNVLELEHNIRLSAKQRLRREGVRWGERSCPLCSF